MVKKLTRLLMILFIAGAFLVAGAGCEKDKGTFEKAGEKMDEAVEEAKDKMEDAGDEIEDMGDKLEDKADKVS